MSESLQLHGLYSPWNSPGQNTGVGSVSLLQGIFPTQGLNPGLPHGRQILYQLSHKGSPVTYMWNLKYGINELIYEMEADSQTQKTDMVTKSERWWWGGIY